MAYNDNNRGMVHFSTARGRTRQPKNVAGPPGADGAAKQNAPAGNASATIAGSASTENQRFLHLLLESTDAGRTRNIVVYGYSYALGRWAPLRDTNGNAVTTGNITNDSAYMIFEIQGVDRVFFHCTTDGSTGVAWDTDDFFRAAASTF